VGGTGELEIQALLFGNIKSSSALFTKRVIALTKTKKAGEGANSISLNFMVGVRIGKWCALI
jgi:hypothetical protein